VRAGTNAAFTVTATGTPATYQWRFKGTNIAGATSSNLVLTNVQLKDSGEYSVIVSNSAGYALSDPATLTVLSAPQITAQPMGDIGYWGRSVVLSVRATGFPPVTYLWYKDGFPITWATNAVLVLIDLQLTDGGTYSVVVSNALGSLPSVSALLIVNPAGVSLGLYPGLTIDGAVGKMYGIQFTTDVSVTNSWTSLTNLTLEQPTQLWFDTSADVHSGKQPRRFYRVVPIP
jgi:hypothetical protein